MQNKQEQPKVAPQGPQDREQLEKQILLSHEKKIKGLLVPQVSAEDWKHHIEELTAAIPPIPEKLTVPDSEKEEVQRKFDELVKYRTAIIHTLVSLAHFEGTEIKSDQRKSMLEAMAYHAQNRTKYHHMIGLSAPMRLPAFLLEYAGKEAQEKTPAPPASQESKPSPKEEKPKQDAANANVLPKIPDHVVEAREKILPRIEQIRRLLLEDGPDAQVWTAIIRDIATAIPDVPTALPVGVSQADIAADKIAIERARDSILGALLWLGQDPAPSISSDAKRDFLQGIALYFQRRLEYGRKIQYKGEVKGVPDFLTKYIKTEIHQEVALGATEMALRMQYDVVRDDEYGIRRKEETPRKLAEAAKEVTRLAIQRGTVKFGDLRACMDAPSDVPIKEFLRKCELPEPYSQNSIDGVRLLAGYVKKNQGNIEKALKRIGRQEVDQLSLGEALEYMHDMGMGVFLAQTAKRVKEAGVSILWGSVDLQEVMQEVSDSAHAFTGRAAEVAFAPLIDEQPKSDADREALRWEITLLVQFLRGETGKDISLRNIEMAYGTLSPRQKAIVKKMKEELGKEQTVESILAATLLPPNANNQDLRKGVGAKVGALLKEGDINMRDAFELYYWINSAVDSQMLVGAKVVSILRKQEAHDLASDLEMHLFGFIRDSILKNVSGLMPSGVDDLNLSERQKKELNNIALYLKDEGLSKVWLMGSRVWAIVKEHPYLLLIVPELIPYVRRNISTTHFLSRHVIFREFYRRRKELAIFANLRGDQIVDFMNQQGIKNVHRSVIEACQKPLKDILFDIETLPRKGWWENFPDIKRKWKVLPYWKTSQEAKRLLMADEIMNAMKKGDIDEFARVLAKGNKDPNSLARALKDAVMHYPDPEKELERLLRSVGHSEDVAKRAVQATRLAPVAAEMLPPAKINNLRGQMDLLADIDKEITRLRADKNPANAAANKTAIRSHQIARHQAGLKIAELLENVDDVTRMQHADDMLQRMLGMEKQAFDAFKSTPRYATLREGVLAAHNTGKGQPLTYAVKREKWATLRRAFESAGLVDDPGKRAMRAMMDGFCGDALIPEARSGLGSIPGQRIPLTKQGAEALETLKAQPLNKAAKEILANEVRGWWKGSSGLERGFWGAGVALTAWATYTDVIDAINTAEFVEKAQEYREKMRQELEAMIRNKVPGFSKEGDDYWFENKVRISLRDLKAETYTKRLASSGRLVADSASLGYLLYKGAQAFTGPVGWALMLAEVVIHGAIDTMENKNYQAFVKKAPDWVLFKLGGTMGTIGVTEASLLKHNYIIMKWLTIEDPDLRSKLLFSFFAQENKELLSRVLGANDNPDMITEVRRDFNLILLPYIETHVLLMDNSRVSFEDVQTKQGTVSETVLRRALREAGKYYVDNHLPEVRFNSFRRKLADVRQRLQGTDPSSDEGKSLLAQEEFLKDVVYQLGSKEVFGRRLSDVTADLDKNPNTLRGTGAPFSRAAALSLKFQDTLNTAAYVSPENEKIKQRAASDQYKKRNWEEMVRHPENKAVLYDRSETIVNPKINSEYVALHAGRNVAVENLTIWGVPQRVYFFAPEGKDMTSDGSHKQRKDFNFKKDVDGNPIKESLSLTTGRHIEGRPVMKNDPEWLPEPRDILTGIPLNTHGFKLFGKMFPEVAAREKELEAQYTVLEDEQSAINRERGAAMVEESAIEKEISPLLKQKYDIEHRSVEKRMWQNMPALGMASLMDAEAMLKKMVDAKVPIPSNLQEEIGRMRTQMEEEVKKIDEAILAKRKELAAVVEKFAALESRKGTYWHNLRLCEEGHRGLLATHEEHLRLTKELPAAQGKSGGVGTEDGDLRAFLYPKEEKAPLTFWSVRGAAFTFFEQEADGRIAEEFKSIGEKLGPLVAMDIIKTVIPPQREEFLVTFVTGNMESLDKIHFSYTQMAVIRENGKPPTYGAPIERMSNEMTHMGKDLALTLFRNAIDKRVKEQQEKRQQSDIEERVYAALRSRSECKIILDSHDKSRRVYGIGHMGDKKLQLVLMRQRADGAVMRKIININQESVGDGVPPLAQKAVADSLGDEVSWSDGAEVLRFGESYVKTLKIRQQKADTPFNPADELMAKLYTMPWEGESPEDAVGRLAVLISPNPFDRRGTLDLYLAKMYETVKEENGTMDVLYKQQFLQMAFEKIMLDKSKDVPFEHSVSELIEELENAGSPGNSSARAQFGTNARMFIRRHALPLEITTVEQGKTVSRRLR